jgi:hypothetical protein
VVETVLLAASGERLEVNADAAPHAVAFTSGGSLEVEVLSVAGEPLAGYTREECVPFQEDEVRHRVRWQSRDRLPVKQPFRLRFYLQDAAPYSYRIRR